MTIAQSISYEGSGKKKKLLPLLGLLLLFLFLGQALIDGTTTNLIASFFVVVSAFFTAIYISKQTFIKNPISIFAIVGFNFSTQTGALLVQTLTGTSITFNLQVPISSFIYLFVFQLTLICSHFFYVNIRFFIKSKYIISKSVFFRLGLFNEIPTLLYWVLAILGLFAIGTRDDAQQGEVMGKAIEGFLPFLYFPYLLIFKKNLNRRKLFFTLILFTLILIMFGFMKNTRGVFATAFVVIGFMLVLYYYTYKVIITKRLFKKLLLMFLASLIILKVMTDLADAMVIARAVRHDVSGVELMKVTIDTLLDEHAMETYRSDVDGAINKSYNEVYISNPMFARLITTKFEDSLIYYSQQLTDRQSARVTVATIDKSLALMPAPMLRLFNIDVDKTQLYFSIADFAWYQLEGGALGGFKVSPLLGHGLIVFGFAFFVITFFLTPFLFLILDSFVIRMREGIVYSPLILISLYSVYKIFTTGSLIGPLGFVLRAIPQLIILFILVKFFFSVAGFIVKNQRAAR
jgi:DNA-binding ferritin-like protein (Dps family)